jgi:serine/threonine protein kinase
MPQLQVGSNKADRFQQLQRELSTDDPLRKYKVGKKIGRGATSDVYRGECSSTGEKVAIKMLPLKTAPSDDEILPRFINEIIIQRDYPHPNIPKYLDSYVIGKLVWIVMENVHGLSLAGKSISASYLACK